MKYINKYLFLYVLGYISIWAVLPNLFYNVGTMDIDTLGIFHRANNLDLISFFSGKHPGLTDLIFKVLLFVSPTIFAANLIGSALGMSISLIFIYKIMRLFYDENEATLITILSSCSIFYMLRYFIEFNHNLVLLPIWISSIYYFLLAIRTNSLKYWIILAVVCALGVYSKFQMFLMIGILFSYLVFNFEKKYIKNVVISFIIFISLMLPEIVALTVIDNAFNYVFSQVGQDNYGFYLVSNDANFVIRVLAMQVFNVINLFFVAIPVAIVLILYGFKKISLNRHLKLSNPIVIFGIAPLVVFFIIQSVKGQLPAGWLIVTMSMVFPAFCILFEFKVLKVINLKKIIIWVLSLQFLIFAIYNIAQFTNNMIIYTNIGNNVAVAAEIFWDKYSKVHTSAKNVPVVGWDEQIVGIAHNYHTYSPDSNYNGNILAVYKDCDLTQNKASLVNQGFEVLQEECVPVRYTNKIPNITYDVSFFIVGKNQ